MHIIRTDLPEVLIIEPRPFVDARGMFLETFSMQRYRDEAGITDTFVQDNVSHSMRGVLRGLHFQRQRPQGKLVQVLAGRVFDVAVDIRFDSPSFGHSVTTELSARNHRQLWIPPGFAHGFCVLSAHALVHYKCTDYYAAGDEGGIAWNCPELAIRWPIVDPILSDRDRRHPGLSQLMQQSHQT